MLKSNRLNRHHVFIFRRIITSFKILFLSDSPSPSRYRLLSTQLTKRRMKLSIPPSLYPAITSIRWSLDPSASNIPMIYEPHSSLKDIRNKSNKSTVALLDNLGDNFISLKTTSLASPNPTSENDIKHYITLASSLIYLGNGFSDEAHNLVTPLSWGEDTYFGGYSMTSRASNEIISTASYIHSLIHRREGFAMGEYSMVGYQNANYWGNVASSKNSLSNNKNKLPYNKVRREILRISQDFGVEAECWCQEHILSVDDDQYWEVRALHQLCAMVSKQAQIEQQEQKEDNNNNKDLQQNPRQNRLKEFAERAAEMEVRVLLQHCLDRAGFECPSSILLSYCGDEKQQQQQNQQTDKSTSFVVDENIAQSTANKISSAHIDSFQSNGCVTLRNMLPLTQNSNDDATDSSLSVVSGIACRLLGCSAVTLLQSEDENLCVDGVSKAIVTFLPTSDSSTNGFNSLLDFLQKNGFSSLSSSYGGGDLQIGDVFAFLVGRDDLSTLEKNNLQNSIFIFTSSSLDTDNTFTDRFYGSRGETPTTVVQWSKGTIFKTH